MQPRITPLNTERKEWTPQELVERWRQDLQEHDRSAGTVKKYTQAVVLCWLLGTSVRRIGRFMLH